MTESTKIWMDGEMVPQDQAQVSVLSHSLHYGSAAFEGIRAYQTKDGRTAIFRAREHFQRFFDSMTALGYSTEYTLEEYIEAARACVKANKLAECYIRPLAWIDDTVRGLKLPDLPKPHSMIAVWSWGKYLGDDAQTRGISAMVSSFRRPDVASSLPWAKLSGNYLNSILARREAAKSGMDEAILLDSNGFVAEGSGENIFIVKNNKLLTPPPHCILPGITRDAVLTLAKDAGLEVLQVPLTRNELYLADEAFFTGTAVEITAIREIDHHRIGEGRPGRITKQLSDTFFKAARGELTKYADWLTFL